MPFEPNLDIHFDQYQRYAFAAQILNSLRIQGQTFTLLEIGANFQRNLEKFLPLDQIMYSDRNLSDEVRGDPQFVEADATQLPFEDRSFDFVIALDVLEHIDPLKRDVFINQLSRVAREGLILAAPFDTDGVANSEKKANDLFRSLAYRDHPWLIEHLNNGLPDLSKTEKAVANNSLSTLTLGHGSLAVWDRLMSAMMLVIAKPEFGPELQSLDRHYNQAVFLGDVTGPVYRHFIVATRNTSHLDLVRTQISRLFSIPGSRNNQDTLDNLLLNLFRKAMTTAYRQEQERSEELDQRNHIFMQTQRHLEMAIRDRRTIRQRLGSRFLAANQSQFPSSTGRFPLKVIPKQQLTQEIKDDLTVWTSEGTDPQFILKGPFPAGPLKVSISATVLAGNGHMKLYYAKRGAYHESQTLDLGLMSNTGTPLQRRFILPFSCKNLRFDPLDGPGKFTLHSFEVESLSPRQPAQKKLNHLFKDFQSRDGARLALDRIKLKLKGSSRTKDPLFAYYQDYLSFAEDGPQQYEKMRATLTHLSYKPVFSIVVPVYNVKARWLRAMAESVINQVYPHWEICFADDASTDPQVRKVLESLKARDPRIKVVYREKNGHISAATNSAMELAKGDYYVLMDNDDEIAPNALFEFAKKLNEDPSLDMIYSDEDKLDLAGYRYEPFFKPDWSPEYLESAMFTAHLACYRKGIADSVGRFRQGYDGAQDYDFVLRFTEKTDKIAHIPKILYHWRAIPGSTASSMDAKNYVIQAAIRGLEDRLARTGRKGTAKMSRYAGCFDLRWELPSQPLVSIILPTGGFSATVRGQKVDLLQNCVEKVLKTSTYENLEFIIVDNGDLSKDRRNKIEAISKSARIHWVTYLEPEFNIAKKINLGAQHAQGEFLLILNDDIEPIAPDWIQAMLEQGLKGGVGVVGAKLLYENDTLQHAGVTFCRGLPDHVRKHFHRDEPGYFFSTVGTRNWTAVTGACMLTPTAQFRSVGGYSEDFGINYNDIDYCLKVRSQGKRIVYTPHAEMYHFESVSREAKVKDAEIDLFLERWGNLVQKDPYYNDDTLKTHPPDFSLCFRILE
ncbi:glycosyltransferase [Bdellovibrionota bacterium FG-1]